MAKSKDDDIKISETDQEKQSPYDAQGEAARKKMTS